MNLKCAFLLFTLAFLFCSCASKSITNHPSPPMRNNGLLSPDINALFAQPYIDPLTRYIEMFEGDKSQYVNIQRVKNEQRRRCNKVAQRFAKGPVNTEMLQRYRDGYTYSCSADVEAFAKLVIYQIDQKDKSQELNDCYLLTQIRNFSEALNVCTKPAEQGDIKAQTNMATMTYALQKYDKAMQWALKAASLSGKASNLIGDMYLHGLGIDANIEKAKKWFEQAVNLGFTDAKSKLRVILSSKTYETVTQ